MKKNLGLLIGALLLSAAPVFAQSFDPDTIRYDAPNIEQPTPRPAASGLFPELNPYYNAQPEPQAPAPQPAESSAAPNKDVGNIILSIDNVEIMTPPAGLAVCFAQLVAQNNTLVPIQNITVQATFGELTSNLIFNQIAPNANASKQIALAGASCRTLLLPPRLNIESCRAPIAGGDCKQLIKFAPMTTDVNL